MTEEQFNPFKPKEKHADFPEFFQGMACAYEDCARLIEAFRDNLPEELKFMESGMDDIAVGIRGKIGELEVAVINQIALNQKEGKTEQ